MTGLWMALVFAGGYHFIETTIFDARLGSLREKVDVLVDDRGRISLVAFDRAVTPQGAIQVRGGLILPPLSDFYSLAQERGLGLDQDLDPKAMNRLAVYLKRLGIRHVRDPIFPKEGLTASLNKDLDFKAMSGYLELPGGPSAMFSQVLRPDRPLDEQLDRLENNGPLTLWWTDAGTGNAIPWLAHLEFSEQVVHKLRERGFKVGVYVQDARPDDVLAALRLPFDFMEGLPQALSLEQVSQFPRDLIWIPLVALNDRRYCADSFRKRLGQVSVLGLYREQLLEKIRGRLDQVEQRVRERCLIWHGRRQDTLASVRHWLARGGKIGLGSSGGHMFCFSGDLRSELDLLDDLGASKSQLLAAAFVHTPALLGTPSSFLTIGKPASFIVYRKSGPWQRQIGMEVTYHFANGLNILSPTDTASLDAMPPPSP